MTAAANSECERADARIAALPDNLPALTTIRFVLALGVVLFHYQLQWTLDTRGTGLIERARLGVDMFFILSGFVLFHAYRGALEAGSFNYPKFLAARLARIYPAHLAVLAFVVFMVVAAGLIGAEFDTTFYNSRGFLTTLLLVQAWTPEFWKAEWNGPSWSLSAEWFAYLAFPLFAWLGLILRRRPYLLIALAGVVFIGLDQFYQVVFGDTVVHAEANMGVLRIIPEFLYGLGLYRLAQQAHLSPRTALAASTAAFLGLLSLMHFQADDRLIVMAAGPMLLSLGLLSKARSDGWITRPWMVMAGECSYALYLVHMPILIGWKGVVSALSERPSSYLFQAWEVLALLSLTLIAAVGLHFLIERPARDWIRRRAARRWPAIEGKAVPTPGSQPPDV